MHCAEEHGGDETCIDEPSGEPSRGTRDVGKQSLPRQISDRSLACHSAYQAPPLHHALDLVQGGCRMEGWNLSHHALQESSHHLMSHHRHGSALFAQKEAVA